MKQEVNNYLTKLLTIFNPYVLCSEDKEKLKKSKVEFITNKLSRKKFRRRRLISKRKEIIREKVRKSVLEKKLYI